MHASHFNRRTLAIALLASSSLVAISPASAQDSGNDENTIIVTAQKREQNLQDVPASVTALGTKTSQAIARPQMFGELVAHSLKMRALVVTLEQLALSDITVLNDGGFVTVAGNVVARNLSCTGLAPAVSSDDPETSTPDPNTVGRNAIGQCAGLTS